MSHETMTCPHCEERLENEGHPARCPRCDGYVLPPGYDAASELGRKMAADDVAIGTTARPPTLADAAEYLPRAYNDLRLVQAAARQAGDQCAANLAYTAMGDVWAIYHRVTGKQP